jgi:uncharacterized membrane protein YadS
MLGIVWARSTRINVSVNFTGIGLSADFRQMLKTGLRPIVFGLFVWFVVAVVSLLVQSLSGQL